MAWYPPSRVNAPWITRRGLRLTDQAASPASNPATRSRAVTSPSGPASTANSRWPSATSAPARAWAPSAFPGRIVSMPSRSWPTQTARPPSRVNAPTSARSAAVAAASAERLPTSTTERARWARISETYSSSPASPAAVLDTRRAGRRRG